MAETMQSLDQLSSLKPATLAAAIRDILDRPGRRDDLSRRARARGNPDAAGRIAAEVLTLIGR